MAEVRQRLEASVGLVKLPPWPHSAAAAAPNAAAFLAHRFGKAVRLIANIAAFDSLLPRAGLISMALERLLQQQACFAVQWHLSEALSPNSRPDCCELEHSRS